MSGARGLVAKWRRLAAYEDEDGLPEIGFEESERLTQCAADLERELSLSDEEREAIELMNARRSSDTHRGWFLAHAETYDTLRALVTRLTAASDGGVKGENHE